MGVMFYIESNKYNYNFSSFLQKRLILIKFKVQKNLYFIYMHVILSFLGKLEICSNIFHRCNTF